jgi:hypothetical protein
MSILIDKYCLDTNVLIQAWRKYYNPKFCPDYWEILIELGKKERIFIPEEVYEEIVRTEDDLSKWFKGSKIPIKKTNEEVLKCLKNIYSFDPKHKYLVDNTKQRSLADPWIIAHSMHEKATVVTKEDKIISANSTRIKIPNVCDNMGVPWINDFQLVEKLNIKFLCKLI